MQRKKVTSVGLLMIISLSFAMLFAPQEIVKQGESILLGSPLFAVNSDENADGDSNVDGVANIGVTNSSYIDVQSLNGAYQGITEASSGGVENDTEFIHNSTDDYFSPTNLGTYSNNGSMNVNDNIYNTLTEVQSGNPAYDNENDVDSNGSDVDSSADIGTETNFNNAQGTSLDSTYMNIQESNTGGAGTDVEDFMDAITDSQTPTDLGTYSNWNEMQDSDLVFNTLTEVDSGGGGSITIEGVYTGSCKKTNTCTITSVVVPTSTDRAMYVFVSAYTKSTGGCAGNQEEANVDWDTAGVNEAFTNVGCDNTNKDRVSIWKVLSPTEKTATITLDNSASNNWNWNGAVFGVYVLSGVHQTTSDDGFNSNNGDSGSSTVSVSSASGDLVLDVVATSSALTVDGSQTEKWNFQSPSTVFGGSSTEAGATTVSMDWTFTSNTWGSAGVSINPAGSSNYEFDREFSFTSLDFSQTNEELAIRTGVIGTESIKIDVWEASAWVNIVTIVNADDNTWINISISTWLDSSNEYFRFIGNTESADTAQNTWEIDSVLIHSWTSGSTNFEIDFEYQWTTAEFSNTTEEIAINIQNNPAGEDLRLWEWSGSAWIFIVNLTTNGWMNNTLTQLSSSTFTIKFNGTVETSDTTQNSWDIDLILIHVAQSSTINNRFDREVSFFNGGSTYNYSNVELVVNTGALDVDEIISIELYNTTNSNWVWITNLTSVNSWTNVSIISNVTNDLYFRFLDTSLIGDLTTDIWEIDYIAVHLWNLSINYRLDWEHNITSIPSSGQITVYKLTLYASATEDIDVYMWNSSSSSWLGTSIVTINATIQWLNVSVSCGSTGVCGSTMVLNYRDTIILSDGTQSELSIDYAGIYVYSMDVNISNPTISVSALPNATDISFNIFPESILIDSGTTFTLQVRGIDVTGTPVADGWIFFDTDSNPSGYSTLTTSYQNLYVSQDPSITSLNIWLWANIPIGNLIGTKEFTLDIRIIPS